jgi:hypothetical protein
MWIARSPYSFRSFMARRRSIYLRAANNIVSFVVRILPSAPA